MDDADRRWLLQHFTSRLEDIRSITRRGEAGTPLVVEVRPLRSHLSGTKTPCPTLWWLVGPSEHRAVSRLEAAGWIRSLENRLASDEALRARYHEDHRRYAHARLAALDDEERSLAHDRGWLEALSSNGIGGIRNPDAIKCLHLHYAHHLMQGSLVGSWVEALLTRPHSTPRVTE